MGTLPKRLAAPGRPPANLRVGAVASMDALVRSHRPGLRGTRGPSRGAGPNREATGEEKELELRFDGLLPPEPEGEVPKAPEAERAPEALPPVPAPAVETPPRAEE